MDDLTPSEIRRMNEIMTRTIPVDKPSTWMEKICDKLLLWLTFGIYDKDEDWD